MSMVTITKANNTISFITFYKEPMKSEGDRCIVYRGLNATLKDCDFPNNKTWWLKECAIKYYTIQYNRYAISIKYYTIQYNRYAISMHVKTLRMW